MKRGSVFVCLASIAMLCACGASPTVPTAVPTAMPTASPILPSVNTFEFLGSNPAPGSTITISGSESRGFYLRASDLQVNFSLLVARPVSDYVIVNVAFLDVDGHECFSNSTYVPSIVAGRLTPVTIGFFSRPDSLPKVCPSPVRRPRFDTTSLDVTVESPPLHPIAHQIFPARYRFNATLAPVVTSPEIVGLRYGSPYTGYPPELQCDVRDADGDALTITAAAQDGAGRQIWSKTISYPSRPIDETVSFAYLFEPDPPTHGTMTCTAVDAHEHSTTRPACFTMDGQPPCPEGLT
jgi:hypothetical protein